MSKQPSKVEVEGPGFRRMKARLGPERMEEMRQQVLREQDEAMARALRAPRPAAAPAQDRAGYRDYPACALRKKPQQHPEERARARRARIRQIGGDDGYQYCLIIDGAVRYNGMTRSEATWRRMHFIQSGEL